MPVPLDHGKGLVSQHCVYIDQACAIHRQVRSCIVSEVVKLEVSNAGFLQRKQPDGAERCGATLQGLGAGKNKIAICAPALPLLKRLEQLQHLTAKVDRWIVTLCV